MQRLVRVLLAGVAAQALVCWLLLQWGLFRGGPERFYALFALFALGYPALMMLACFTQEEETGPRAMGPLLMGWFALTLLISVWFLEQAGLWVMSFFFMVLQQGVLRVRQAWLVWIAVAMAVGYGVMSLVMQASGRFPEPGVAWMHWGLFVLVTALMVLLAVEIGAIRQRLHERNDQLSTLLQHIREMALKDELTGLYSRGHAMERLVRACAQAQRGAFRLGVAFVDLDHFKRINDRHGHLFGDRVLVRFAELARECLREQDLVARFGGEEFLVLLPLEADSADAEPVLVQVLEALLETLRAQRFLGAPALTVTASAGMTVVAADESPDQVLARADRLLYQAKSAGRDRVVFLELR